MSRLKSAVDARQRPTAALLELPDPFSGWTSHDYRIQEAVNIMDRETCGKCGNPVWICHTSHAGVQFEVTTLACYATAEIEDFDKNPNAPKLEAGEYRVARPVGLENEDGTVEPLPTRLEALEQM